MRSLWFATLLLWPLPASAGKLFPLFRPQPVLGHGEPLRIEEVGRYLRDALGEVGDYEVDLLDPDRSEQPFVKSAKVERLSKRWRSEIDFAETNLRRRKPGLAIKGAKVVWRRLSRSPALVQDPEILCRTYLVFAEASLQLKQEQKAEEWVKRLAGSCANMYRDGKWRAKSSPAFLELVRKTKAVMRHAAPAQITILTEQAGAEVYLDARLVGTTPMNLTGIPPGPHVLRVEEVNRKPWCEWIELSAAPRTLRIQGQANWLRPAEVGLQRALQNNVIDDAAVSGAKALLTRLAPGAPYLAMVGVLESEGAVKLRLILIDRRGRILRVPEVMVDESFLGLEAELSHLFKAMGKVRWTALNKGPIFPNLEEAQGEAPEVRFKALVEARGAVEAEDERNEDKDEDPDEDDEQEEKDRLRPVIRGEGAKKKSSSAGPIKRRARTYTDFKDEDDK
jgi:hypothetical protein